MSTATLAERVLKRMLGRPPEGVDDGVLQGLVDHSLDPGTTTSSAEFRSRLPEPITLCGHTSDLVISVLGSTFFVFEADIAEPLAQQFGLEYDEARAAPRPAIQYDRERHEVVPCSLAGMLHVYVRNDQGGFEYIDKDELDPEERDALLDDGSIRDDLYFQIRDYPQFSPSEPDTAWYMHMEILMAYTSRYTPGYTLFGFYLTGHMTDAGRRLMSMPQEVEAAVEETLNERGDEEKERAVQAVQAGKATPGELFIARRRQRFIREAYAVRKKQHYEEAVLEFQDELLEPENDSEDKSRLTWAIADFSFNLFCVRYTAGEPIEPLREDLERVVAAYEQYTVAVRVYEDIQQYPALSFDLLDEFTRCQQLIGLCYLLHRRDLLPRIAALQDPNYGATDFFYEDFLNHGLPGRPEPETIYHEEPYKYLHDAMCEDTDEESLRDIEIFLSKWYKSLRNAPWHDTHLQMSETQGAYFGYWAFEAGAVAYLLNLDDASIDHMTYPKDLVAWARANEHLRNAPADTTGGRCEAGQPCPREGYWFTPAQLGSRRYFKAGEVMPAVISDYGLTLWQWDAASQEPPRT